MVRIILSGQMDFQYDDDEVRGMTKDEIISMAEDEFYEFVNNIILEVEDYDDDRDEEEEDD